MQNSGRGGHKLIKRNRWRRVHKGNEKSRQGGRSNRSFVCTLHRKRERVLPLTRATSDARVSSQHCRNYPSIVPTRRKGRECFLHGDRTRAGGFALDNRVKLPRDYFASAEGRVALRARGNYFPRLRPPWRPSVFPSRARIVYFPARQRELG